jgi:hypothetical protein
MKPFIEMKLPNGQTFKTWEQELRPSKVYRVAQQHPKASDDNDGSEASPFRTIERAAAILAPGEQVIVHEGVYREWVHPASGGDAPDRMIWYKAADNEQVVLKGSDEWRPAWVRSRYIRSPEYEPLGELLPGLVPGREAFAVDLLSRDRKGIFGVGPIANLPLDGTEVSIDPRLCSAP